MQDIQWDKISEVVVIAIAVVYLARTILNLVKTSGESDKREDGLLKQLIELATSYKTESAEARDAYKAESAATREVVSESNNVQRAHTLAITEQTGEIRLLRSDFKNYQVLNADEIDNFRTNLDSLKTEIIEHLLILRSQAEYTKNCAESAKGEREIINRKLDDLIQCCQTQHNVAS